MINKSTYSKNSWRQILIVILFLCNIIWSLPASAQIENLIVETYYIADANDATDTTAGRSLTEGMKTYRVYLDLAPNSNLHSIFGNVNHPLRVTSTDIFYNNIDRPNANFGYLINKSWYNDNPTLALDSWFTIGMASTVYLGIPKSDDSDGSIIGGSNNGGGTAAIPGGIMVNSDPFAGIPVTVADGLMPNTNTLGQWLDLGFEDISGEDTTVFGPLNTGTEFLSTSVLLQQNNGVKGADTISNKVLVGQFTTLGELSFELNVTIEQFDGTNYNMVTYVANGDSLLAGEIVSPSLTYPPSCGCTDPQYLEYSNSYACNLQDSCITLIVFGCLDTLACNYDPNANFNLPTLCCYPGYCNDRDLSVVCPSISAGRFGIDQLYPSPGFDQITISCTSVPDEKTTYSIYDALGKLVKEESVNPSYNGILNFQINISNLNKGLYFILVKNGNMTDTKTFMKADISK